MPVPCTWHLLGAFGRNQVNYFAFHPYRPVITAATPKAMAKPMKKHRAMLLKFNTPLPVTVTAHMIERMVNTAMIMLTILQRVLFIPIPFCHMLVPQKQAWGYAANLCEFIVLLLKHHFHSLVLFLFPSYSACCHGPNKR